jgi:predicted secreted hydrolase
MKTLPPLFVLLFFVTLPCFSQAKDSSPTKLEGYAVPQKNPRFTFPRDHGAHPDFRIEWWYITGHLFTLETPPRRFGFQATFFRQAAPLTLTPPAASAYFAHDQIYLAHMALLDVATGRFIHQERLNRAGWNASAATDTLDVMNGDWQLRLTDPVRETLALRGGIRAEARFDFAFSPEKSLVRFGEGGYSRKGSAATAASYYLTFSRLGVNGTLQLDAVSLPVQGFAWMDHEISSSQLDTNQVGWDWLSIHFRDGRELMLYRLRLRDGSSDPASTLTWVDNAGRTMHTPFRLEVLDTWKSPHTGAVYPHRLKLHTTDPASGRTTVLQIEPLAKDQELGGALGGVTYYEGACRVVDEQSNELGSAYLELTGYDQPVDALR